jgi:hypothetical protein
VGELEAHEFLFLASDPRVGFFRIGLVVQKGRFLEILLDNKIGFNEVFDLGH